MKTESPIVYLVDDEPAVLKGIVRVLRLAGFRTAAYESSSRFLAEHDPEQPGCAVLDLAMPGPSGLELQQRLASPREGRPPRRIIFLTGRADVPQSVAAMKRGAVDFLTKPVDEEALVAAVHRALEIDRQAREERSNAEALASRLSSLTPREREVLAYVVTGMLNKQVAAELGTTEGTVKVHRARVMQKLGIGSLAELVRVADSAGIERMDSGSPLRGTR